MSELKHIEAIEGLVRSEPLNRNFSYVESKAQELVDDVDHINKKTSKFDFTSVSPAFFKQLHFPLGTILQCFVINEKTHEIYATQAVPNTDPEDYLLARFSLDGTYKDHMILENGGHGTSFGIENSGSSVYVWSPYLISNKWELVRFRYRGGTTLKPNSSSLQKLNKFTNDYVIPTINEAKGLVGFRIRVGTKETFELRKLSDVKDGVDNLLGSLDMTSYNVGVFQGFSADEDDLYWYTGTSDPNDAEILRIGIRSGQVKSRITPSFGKDTSGGYEHGFREPEGMYLYTAEDTGAVSLFCGVAVGQQHRRVNMIYGYHSLGNEAKFLSESIRDAQKHMITDDEGNAKRIPYGTTKLSDVDQSGIYYFSSVDWDFFEDAPDTDRGGGYLHVYPPAPNNGTFQQVLWRHSSSGYFWSFRRQITEGESVTRWFSEPIAGGPKWIDLPLNSGSSVYEGDNLQYAISGNVGFLRGRVSASNTDGHILANLPEEATPGRNTHMMFYLGGTTGFRNGMIASDGRIVLYGIMANNPESITFTGINATYTLRNEA